MKVSHEVPTPHEYLELRKAAGLRAIHEDAAKTALNRSIFSTVVRGEQSELIGMGRIIGDGGCFFQIVDIAVKPAGQNEELKKMIMNEITDYLRRHAPAGAEVIIMADVPSIGLYQTYGFDYTYPSSISLRKTC
ncbi:GNAT family N-acetyltransferase [Bacillus sonorensis]|uniref:GNAT family N-acetyltransferase n=1 Tax=Bacillus sonorensis TaxID=119858 RepID=UPI002280704E|nr:GNAT family N-acetyltransferase [Bacillus sonorensis]MCZ0069956.1 GNAT family N-acetyltransferase [Bacillus sonorensis]MCZ0097344.1 GNAT family N-acetyltransferase [Bacillus sonorensis]MEC1516919.1 GNAT family N-acetyltransferase [Bacillus sonorensis]